MKLSLPYIDEAKPGFFYYRRDGRRWGRLPGRPGSVEFAKEYERLNRMFDRPDKVPALPGTVAALCEGYLASAEFGELKDKTRWAYRHDIDTLRGVLGPHEAKNVQPPHVLRLRDKLKDKPGKANTMVRTGRAVWRWGMARGMVKTNPFDLRAVGVKALRIGEHKPWTPDALETFRKGGAAHLVLALDVALFTGQRMGDVIRIRWDDFRQGSLRIVQEKTGKELWIPMHREFLDALERAPKIAETVVTSSAGRPWASANPLAQSFSRETKRLGLEGFRFHGLRKTTAVVLAESGCTTKQIAAITGQSDQMVSHYAKLADRERLAKAAVRKWERKKDG